MSSISVTQALSELKLLRKRIESVTSQATFTKVKKANDLLDAAKFATQATASYQSFTDLTKRYNALKSAIVLSNATTKVTIGGTEYTVADAVERKRSIEMENLMLAVMKAQHTATNVEYERHQLAEQQRVERLLTTELAKDAKTNVEVVQQLTTTFLAQNKATVLDPLGLAEKIEALSKSIEDFETQVDYSLSESNGRTLISV
jgi:hypothetical protein